MRLLMQSLRNKPTKRRHVYQACHAQNYHRSLPMKGRRNAATENAHSSPPFTSSSIPQNPVCITAPPLLTVRATAHIIASSAPPAAPHPAHRCMLELYLLHIMLHIRIARALRHWDQAIMDALPTQSSPETWPSTTATAATAKAPTATAATATAAPHRHTRRRRRGTPPLHNPRFSHPSAVASPTSLAALQPHLPARFNATDWRAVYSTMRHGVSLHTFYANCAGPEPVVLLVRDTRGAVFGYYSSFAWHPSSHYYGSGEAFLFTIAPKFAVYKWSRANSFFQLGAADSMAVGGGGKFALFLDSMFERGTSGPCDTYNSPCLASTPEFDVVVLEAYKLVAPHTLKTHPAEE